MRVREALRIVAMCLAVSLGSAPLLALPAASASEAPTSRAEAGRTTTVVLRVQGCDGCEVSATRLFRVLGGSDYWSSPRTTVRHGSVTLRVPRRHTRGMYFSMLPTADRAAFLVNAVQLISWRYAGRDVGQKVRPGQAARARSAHGCWAGTDRRRVSFDVRVDRWWGTNLMTGERGYEIRPYLVRGGVTVGPAKRTVRGTLGTQDADVCSVL